MNTTQSRVIKLLVDRLDLTNVQLEHDIDKDLGCDSLDRIETMIALEEEFHIEIIEDDFEKLHTVQQIIEYIEGLRRADASTNKAALIMAERFITGFEDDDTQEGVDIILSNLRKAIAQTHVRERYITALNQVCIEGATELDELKNVQPIPEEKRESIKKLIERMHSASAEVTA